MTRLAMAATIALMTSLAPKASSAESCPDLIVAAFGERATQACSVASCETGGTFDEYATGALGERGWFQIRPIHGRLSSYDPETNVMAAMTLSRGGYDWSAWSCRP